MKFCNAAKTNKLSNFNTNTIANLLSGTENLMSTNIEIKMLHVKLDRKALAIRPVNIS